VKAAIAAGLFLGVGMDDIAEAIESFTPSANRSQINKTQINTLICDSYNANPTSMNLALRSFDSLIADSKVVIVGDMLELGEKSEEEHLKVLDYLRSMNVEKSLLVGRTFMKISDKSEFMAFPDVNELIQFLKGEPLKGKTILVKGSRGIGLEKVYSLL
jgi:UDP-N-acetylmuramoyl-tripeptide--D-alanyl-D-alanine ligase